MKLDVNTHEGYDIATALRGPDFEGGRALKRVFTARLRVLVGSRIDGMRLHRELTASTVDDVCREAFSYKPTSVSNDHFLWHLLQAYNALYDRLRASKKAATEAGILRDALQAIVTETDESRCRRILSQLVPQEDEEI